MNEKDCVSVFIDIFKWGIVILTAVTGWMLSKNNVLDWTDESTGKQIVVRVIFLCFSAGFWCGWAFVLAHVRRRAVELSDGGTDFLRSIGLAHVHWVFCGIALAGSWYIVFDSQPGFRPSIVTALTFFALFSALVVSQKKDQPSIPEVRLQPQ